MRTLGVTTFPVGDNVLVHEDYAVLAPKNIGRVDFGIAAAVDCFAIQSVEAKLPTMTVSVGEASNIMRAGPSCGSDATVANMMGRYNVPWCDVCISNRGAGWLVWILTGEWICRDPCDGQGQGQRRSDALGGWRHSRDHSPGRSLHNK